MKLLFRLLFFIPFILSGLTISAQTTSLPVGKIIFQTDLDGRQIDSTCYQITPDRQGAIGRIWYPETFNINRDFLIDMNIFLGCDDKVGGDGLLFIFNNKPIFGIGGPPMGKPSFGIEIDTYYNKELNDPDSDHIAVLNDNHFDHAKGKYPPISIPNIEDCNYHPFKIRWQASTQVLTIQVDDDILFNDKVGLKNIFAKNRKLHWGIAASGIIGKNAHKVCFEELQVQQKRKVSTPTATFNRQTKKALLDGKIMAFDNFTFDNYTLNEKREGQQDLEKLAHLLKEHPNLYIDVFAHVFKGTADQSTIGLSVMRANEVKKALVQRGISGDRIQAKGMGGKFPRNKKDLARGKLNERIELYIYNPLP